MQNNVATHISKTTHAKQCITTHYSTKQVNMQNKIKTKNKKKL